VEIALAEPTPLSEHELVLRAQAGESAAFGVLVERYMRRAYYAALGLVGSPEDALDLSQEAFMRVHRAYLANVYRIREIIPWENNSFRIRMGSDDGPVIPVSRANARELKRRLHL